MELRDYQKDGIQQLYNAWNEGAKNVLICLATGGGKTVIFCRVMIELNVPSIAIAHRMELVSQISLTLARHKIRHNIIAQKAAIREIISLHVQETGRSYYDQNSKFHVAGVDTLIRMPRDTPWFERIELVIQDEGHHPLVGNKWGEVSTFFPNARGLYPTATPCRADGKGLGRHADGIIDKLIVFVSMRTLIKRGYLTDYRIFAPPSDLDLSTVPVTATGDYSAPKLRQATHQSHITGDVVAHYLKIAPGKLGVTFAVDIEAAVRIAQQFRDNNVPAEVISGKTPDLLRAQLMRQFRDRKILQLVNVDLLGEGVDVPAIEVVSMARATHSYGLFSQQFGRALRPLPGKSHAIIIDHVGNTLRHGLPDAPRIWSLDRKDRRSRGKTSEIPLRNCTNPSCFAVYEGTSRSCPYCGHYSPPAGRSTPEMVDGDLNELDPNVLRRLRGEIERIDDIPKPPCSLSGLAQLGYIKKHNDRRNKQVQLRSTIASWAGYLKHAGKTDSEILRTFYFIFGIDVATAQTLGTSDANELMTRVQQDIDIKRTLI